MSVYVCVCMCVYVCALKEGKKDSRRERGFEEESVPNDGGDKWTWTRTNKFTNGKGRRLGRTITTQDKDNT